MKGLSEVELRENIVKRLELAEKSVVLEVAIGIEALGIRLLRKVKLEEGPPYTPTRIFPSDFKP